jgi:hypothetical protein
LLFAPEVSLTQGWLLICLPDNNLDNPEDKFPLFAMLFSVKVSQAKGY